MTNTDTPRIYVACLASYNNGVLFGRWIDATMDADDIRADISELLANSKVPGAEEWAIHDYDGFGDAALGENPDLDKVSEAARMIEKHGDAWLAYVGNVGADYASEEDFEDSYRGTYRAAEDYAEELLSECGDLDKIPENLRSYFDFQAYARDMGYEGYAFIPGGDGVYVFAPT